MSPTTSASFRYDPLGRRVERAVNGQSTQYVYDGLQAIGEITNGQTAGLLTGLALDEVIARYSMSDTRAYLRDALGSVIAQVKDDQSVQNFYGYSPYGEVQPLGPDEGNSIQYTARENDRTGLYFYRARYYDPVLKRFIAEDPIGMLAGPNFYAYVSGNPVSYRDPLGEQENKPPTGKSSGSQSSTPASSPITMSDVQSIIRQDASYQTCVRNAALAGALAGACVGAIPGIGFGTVAGFMGGIVICHRQWNN